MLHHNSMIAGLTDPLALSASALSRLALVGGVVAVLWAGVVWALAA